MHKQKIGEILKLSEMHRVTMSSRNQKGGIFNDTSDN
jgi:hypothetical protein